MINIQHMKYAVEVEKTGSISQAADNLYMGQPNLSKSIKELELSLGIRVFKRTTRGVTPTAKGKEFLDSAKQILESMEEMEARYQQGEQRMQSFAISVPRGSYIVSAFTEFIAGLAPEETEMEIRFSETSSIQAVNNVVEEGYRLGIIRYNTTCEPYFLQLLSDQNLSHRDIWEFRCPVVFSESHALAEQETVSLADLTPYMEIYQGGCPARTRFYGKLEKPEKAHPHIRRICVHERASQFDLLVRVPGTYMWVSPMPEDILERNRLVQRVCTDSPYRLKDVLIYPRGYKMTALEKGFLKKLEEAREIAAAAGDKKKEQ